MANEVVFSVFRWGRFTARHPYVVIISSLTLALLSCVGFINFTWVRNVSVRIYCWWNQESVNLPQKCVESYVSRHSPLCNWVISSTLYPLSTLFPRDLWNWVSSISAITGKIYQRSTLTFDQWKNGDNFLGWILFRKKVVCDSFRLIHQKASKRYVLFDAFQLKMLLDMKLSLKAFFITLDLLCPKRPSRHLVNQSKFHQHQIWWHLSWNWAWNGCIISGYLRFRNASLHKDIGRRYFFLSPRRCFCTWQKRGFFLSL